MKRAKYIITSLLTTIVIFGIIQVSVANSISTSGIELGTLQDKITALDKENQRLHEDYLKLASLTHIASEAATLGFVQAKSDIAFRQSSSYAMKP